VGGRDGFVSIVWNLALVMLNHWFYCQKDRKKLS